MTCPCDRCGRQTCPAICYPKRDYDRAMKRHDKQNKAANGALQELPGEGTGVPRPMRKVQNMEDGR